MNNGVYLIPFVATGVSSTISCERKQDNEILIKARPQNDTKEVIYHWRMKWILLIDSNKNASAIGTANRRMNALEQCNMIYMVKILLRSDDVGQ